MPTPYPLLEIDNPLMQKHVERFEDKYLQLAGIDGVEGGLRREYRKHGKRVLVRCLTASVLSGDWGIGQTQKEVGEHLGLDHSCLSDALRKGEMSADTLVALLFAERRPHQWFRGVIDRMNRGGFIAGCNFFAQFVADRPRLADDPMNEWRFELLCEILRRYDLWVSAQIKGVKAVAKEVIETVCGDARREVVPAWYRKDEEARVRTEIRRWRGSEEEAFRRLVELHRDWVDIFFVTAASTATDVRYSESGVLDAEE